MARNCPYVGVACRRLISHYNGPSRKSPLCPYYSLAYRLYLAIIMERHEGPHIALSRAVLGGLYFSIIIYRHEGPHSYLTVA
jgi:hypothetical protein